MELSIVIVNFNVSHYLNQCISSILNGFLDSSFYEIIVVDNNSYDDSRKRITKNFPMVKWIQLDSNYGFSVAVNKAIKQSSGKFICLVNPDTIISNNALSDMLGYLKKNTKTGILGAKVFNPDGSFQLSSRRRFPSFLISLSKILGLSKIFSSNKYNYRDISKDVISDVDSVSGCCMMINKKVVKSVGLFDENFFLYFEDTDYCLRAKNAGFNVKYYPKAHVLHYKGESSSSAPFDVKNKFYESMIYFYKKYHTSFLPWKIFKCAIFTGIFIDKLRNLLHKNFQSIFVLTLDLVTIFSSFYFTVFAWYKIKFGSIDSYLLLITHLPMLTNIVFWWIFISILSGIYKKSIMFSYGSFYAAILVFLTSSATSYFIEPIAFSRVVLFFSLLISGLLTFMFRMYYKILFQKSSKLFSKIVRKVIIVGSNVSILNKLSKGSSNYQIFGYVDKEPSKIKYNYLGRLNDLADLVEKHHIADVIISESSLSVDEIIDLSFSINKAGASFKIIATNNRYIISKGLVEHISGLPVINIALPYFDNVFMFSKRLLDILISLFIIITTLPLTIYFFIRGEYYLEDTKNANLRKIHFFKSNHRLIRFIPQIFNVLFGTLSMVGSNINERDSKIKPGIISPSVMFNRFRTKDQLENLYLHNYSPMVDLEIIMRYIIS